MGFLKLKMRNFVQFLHIDSLGKNFSEGILFFRDSQRLSRKAKNKQISQTRKAV